MVGNPPDLVVMDIMLFWCKPGEDTAKLPEDVATEGFFTAGLRLTKLLSRNPSTENTTVLLWSCIGMEDLRRVRDTSDGLEGAYFLTKSDEFKYDVAEEAKLILEGKTPLHAVRLSAFDNQPPVATHQG